MLEKLFELLLHAKGGAVSAIFVLGATGALVSATTQNGVTTITVTEASPSPSVSVSPTTTTTTSPKPSASPSASISPALIPVSSPSMLTPGATPAPCADEAHARRDAVRLVDRTASDLHVKLVHMRRDARTDTARKAVSDADNNVRSLRHAAVKAIHMTASDSCKDKDDDEDDEDDDEDDDRDEHKGKNDEHKGKNDEHKKPASATLTGTDPKAIAQLAVTAMKAEFDKAKAAVDAQPAATPRPKREGDRKDSNKGKSD